MVHTPNNMEIFNAGDRIMNTYIYRLQSANQYVMVNTGYEHSFNSVIDRLMRHGVSPDMVKYVFLTHAHDDHAGFLNRLLTEYPHIKVIADSKSLPVLRRGQNSFEGGCSGLLSFLFCKYLACLGKGQRLFPPIEERFLNRFIFISDDSIPLIEKELGGRILHTPGHTIDSVSLQVGDIVFCGDAAMNGFPSSDRITIWINDKSQFESSWLTLSSLSPATIYPAHGAPFPSSDLLKYRDQIKRRKLYTLK